MFITINNKAVFLATSGKHFDRSKPTWVFIHGSAMDHSVWTMFNRYFSSHQMNVLAVDLPGHGLSKGQAFNSISDISNWLNELFDVLGLKNAIVCGHSMGALICYDFAARFQQRCLGTVLLGFCLPMPVNQQLLDLSKANDEKALDMIVEFGLAFDSKLGSSQHPGLWMQQSTLQLMRHAPPDTLFHDFTACNNYQPSDSLAKQIDSPLLFIAGDKDRMTPAKGLTHWTGTIRLSSLEILNNCGHMMMIEKPNQVLRLLREFSSKLIK